MKTNTKYGLVALSSVIAVASAGAALAFPFGNSWMQESDSINNPGQDQPTGRAGGGGLWGTGSRLDKGIKCSHCHIEPDGMIDAEILFTPALVNGQYAPGQTYTIEINLLNEVHLPGGAIMNTLNGFALTFETPAGVRAGVLRSDVAGVTSSNCPGAYPATAPNGTSYVYGNCNAIVSVPLNDSDQWFAGWTAPAAGTGPVNLFYGVVDGDHTGEASLDDDTKEGIVVLQEQP